MLEENSCDNYIEIYIGIRICNLFVCMKVGMLFVLIEVLVLGYMVSNINMDMVSIF